MKKEEEVKRERETVPLKEAARRMGQGTESLTAHLRACAMRGVACPIGFALPPGTDRGQWSYIIPRKRFEAYMGGLDLSVPPERLKALYERG